MLCSILFSSQAWTQQRNDEDRIKEGLKAKLELKKCEAQVDSLAKIENIQKQEIVAEKSKKWIFFKWGIGIGATTAAIIITVFRR